jgi:hypothetical protein
MMLVDYGKVRCCSLSKGLEWWRWLTLSENVVSRIC